METLDTIIETQVDSVLDDFEVGDKVHFFRKVSSGSALSGVVKEVEEDCMWVSPLHRGFTLDLIQVGTVWQGEDDIFYVGQWGKIPDENLIKPGDTMSTKHLPWVKAEGVREFFMVLEIVPGRRIILQSNENLDYIAKIDGVLDTYLKYWEMEG